MRKKPKINLNQKSKSEEIKYRIFIGFAFVNVIYWVFFEPLIFGEDIRFTVYVFWLPMLLGIIVSSVFNILGLNWKDLFEVIKKEKNYFWKVIYPIFFLLMNMIFSYIIFGFTARVIWNSINKIESEKNKMEIFYLPVEEFSQSSGRRSSDKIYFRFKNNLESIPISYQTIKPYLEVNPDDYKIVLEVRKGIWNHYVFESWDLIKK